MNECRRVGTVASSPYRGNRWSSERRVKLASTIPSRDRGRRSQTWLGECLFGTFSAPEKVEEKGWVIGKKCRVYPAKTPPYFKGNSLIYKNRIYENI